jgi:hypothetical protein
MRRPHPRFDEVRNAWITRAGGKLMTLTPGLQNAETKAKAWDAFYAHMTLLGNPVEGSSVPVITLGQVADRFGECMQREVDAGRSRPRTFEYYHDQIQKFLDAVGGNRGASGLLPHEVEMYKTNWHSVQVVQRLYNWGVEMGLKENPVRSVKKPDLGQRHGTLANRLMSMGLSRSPLLALFGMGVISGNAAFWFMTPVIRYPAKGDFSPRSR